MEHSWVARIELLGKSDWSSEKYSVGECPFVEGIVETRKRSILEENQMAKQCDVCNKPFKNAKGVVMHKLRSPACGGGKVAWGSTTGKRKSTRNRLRGSNGKSGREAIREILADHPQGLETADIRTQLESRGFHLNTNYVSQAVASDSSLVRVERGRYRLKGNVARRASQRSGASVVQEAVTEAKSGITHLPREALLLRIETLETQNRALHDAHLSLMRGIFV